MDVQHLRNAVKAAENLDPLMPVGTKVEAWSDGFGGKGTVVGHEHNMLGLPLVMVELEDYEGEHPFYNHEVKAL